MVVAKVKPCPFCGGVAEERYLGNNHHRITCKRCLCGTTDCKSKNEARQRWNRRADADQ